MHLLNYSASGTMIWPSPKTWNTVQRKRKIIDTTVLIGVLYTWDPGDLDLITKKKQEYLFEIVNNSSRNTVTSYHCLPALSEGPPLSRPQHGMIEAESVRLLSGHHMLTFKMWTPLGVWSHAVTLSCRQTEGSCYRSPRWPFSPGRLAHL